jgi:hypothetical protein
MGCFASAQRRFDYIRTLLNLSAITSLIESMSGLHHADGLPRQVAEASKMIEHEVANI